MTMTGSRCWQSSSTCGSSTIVSVAPSHLLAIRTCARSSAEFSCRTAPPTPATGRTWQVVAPERWPTGGAVEPAPVRLEGVQARNASERDVLARCSRHGRHRCRPDEPGRLGATRLGEGAVGTGGSRDRVGRSTSRSPTDRSSASDAGVSARSSNRAARSEIPRSSRLSRVAAVAMVFTGRRHFRHYGTGSRARAGARAE